MMRWYEIGRPYGDPLGRALLEYHQGLETDNIIILSDVTEYEPMHPGYFFRDISEMPYPEQLAIDLCRGRILDVGCAAGVHSLELQKRGLEVVGIDLSEGAATVARARGVKDVRIMNFFDIADDRYDTVLLMMNGLGIAGRLRKLPAFLKKCASLLLPGGQIILDSADLLHIFQEEDGSVMMDLSVDYYGEVRYQMIYRNIIGKPFDWLYTDPQVLNSAVEQCGLRMEMITKMDDHSYLARLTLKS